jgi:hypothetical protein
MRPLFGLTQYLGRHRQLLLANRGCRLCVVLLGRRGFDLENVSRVVPWLLRYRKRIPGVLTLKATGSECGFLRWSVLVTSCWKGPVQFSLAAHGRCSIAAYA